MQADDPFKESIHSREASFPDFCALLCWYGVYAFDAPGTTQFDGAHNLIGYLTKLEIYLANFSSGDLGDTVIRGSLKRLHEVFSGKLYANPLLEGSKAECATKLLEILDLACFSKSAGHEQENTSLKK